MGTKISSIGGIVKPTRFSFCNIAYSRYDVHSDKSVNISWIKLTHGRNYGWLLLNVTAQLFKNDPRTIALLQTHVTCCSKHHKWHFYDTIKITICIGILLDVIFQRCATWQIMLVWLSPKLPATTQILHVQKPFVPHWGMWPLITQFNKCFYFKLNLIQPSS